MAYVTVHTNKVKTVDVRPYLDSEVGPFAVVDLVQEDVALHVGPESLERARAIAGSIIAACNKIEEAQRRRAVVPIASLAPDAEPVH